MRVSRAIAAVVVVSLLSACGGADTTTTPPSPAEAQPAPEASSKAIVANGTVDLSALQARADAFRAQPAAAQQALLARLDSAIERDVWEASGLVAALGGKDAADAAFEDHSRAIVSRARGFSVPRFVLASAQGDAEPSIGMGLFGGLMIVSLGAEAIVSRSNDLKDGEKGSAKISETMTISGSLAHIELTSDDTHVGKNVTTRLQIKIAVDPCPDKAGHFKGEATVGVSSTRTGTNVGQNGTLDVKVTGEINDDAALVSSDAEYRMEWADFAAGKGSYVDVSGSMGDTKVAGATLKRSGGIAKPGFADAAAIMGMLYGLMIKQKVVEAAQKGWESGRCVALRATASPGPKGLKPSSGSTITAPPRSRIDGTPAGGSVTSHLSAGGASVAVSGSKVPADATFTYTAPPEQNKAGTVSLEARSRRGVATAAIDFDTNAANAYHFKGGLEDFQVNQNVCDIMKPFSLTAPGVGVAKFSGGLTGTYVATGVFNFHYQGTYTISLPGGPGKPGTMAATSGGQIAGEAGSGTERYRLTPLAACE